MPELEPYAKTHIPLAARRVLAGLQAGCLPLQVELGRFTCLKTQDVWGEAPEDQTHFLLMCPKLREPWVALFKSVSKKYQNFITEWIQGKLSILLHPQEHLYCITMGIYILCTHVGMFCKNWFITSDHSILLFCTYMHTLILSHIPPPLHSLLLLLYHSRHYIVNVSLI